MAEKNNEGSAKSYTSPLRNPNVTLNERNFAAFTHRSAAAHPWHDLEIGTLNPEIDGSFFHIIFTLNSHVIQVICIAAMRVLLGWLNVHSFMSVCLRLNTLFAVKVVIQVHCLFVESCRSGSSCCFQLCKLYLELQKIRSF